MGLYARYVLPRMIDLVMGNKITMARRKQLIPRATGTVLELGLGSGLNLPFYGDSVTKVIGVDPSSELFALARNRLREVRERGAGFAVELVLQSAEEQLPCDDAAVDTVVVTWTLCSIPDPLRALHEAARVLKPGGKLLFAEHGLSPDGGVRTWQNRLTPLWKRMAGGCHLNREIDQLLRDAGLQILDLDRGYAPGPKPMTYMYQGSAALPAT